MANNFSVKDALANTIVFQTTNNAGVHIVAHSLAKTDGTDATATLLAQQGTVTEAAPASDTASAGHNGRLQRIAQRLTTMMTGPTTGTQSSVADTAADATILASNANRKGAMVYNDSSAILYLLLASGTSSITNYSVQVPAAGTFTLPFATTGVYTGVIKGIWASDSSGSARVTEWT